MLPLRVVWKLVASITSTELQRIAFSAAVSGERLAESVVMKIDEALCQLVDRLRELGCEHTLEVEVRGADWEVGWDFERVLPKFKEKGLVRVTEVSW